MFLSVNSEIGAKRVFDQKKQSTVRGEEKKYPTLEKAMEDMEQRKNDEIERFQRVYGLNPCDLKQYDLVIDTSYQTPEEVVQQILDAANLDKGTQKS